MASSTDIYELTDGSWTEVHADAGDCTIQLLTNGPVYVVVDTSEPAADAKGMRLQWDESRSIAVLSTVSGDSVWVRSTAEAIVQEVAVITMVA